MSDRQLLNSPFFLLKKLWFVGAILIGICLALRPMITICSIAFLLIFFGLFLFPQITIPFLLIVRSSLDVFTEIGFYIGPMLVNIPSITSLFLIFGGGLYLLFNIAVRREVRLEKIGKIFLSWLTVLFLWVIISYINFGQDGLIALREWIRMGSIFIIYLLTLHLTKKIGYKKVVNYIFFALPIPLTIGLYQVFTKSGVQVKGINRIYGTLAHPNPFALFLVLFIGMTLWKIQTDKRRLPWIVLLVLESIVFINTYSIGGIIMMATFLFALIFSKLKKKNRIILSVFLIFLFLAFYFSQYGQDRIRELGKTGNIQEIIATRNISQYSTLSWRILNWYFLLKEWFDKPILGYGLNTTADLVNPWREEPHNDFVRFIVETGMLGFLFFVFFLYSVGKELWRIYQISRGRDFVFSSYSLTVFAIYIAWIIGSMASNHITATTYQYYWWVLIAAAVVGCSQQISNRQ